MPKMEIELTEEQLEKVENLKAKNISVGQAIDLLYEVQNEALSQLEEQSHDEGFIDKIKDTALDSEIKEVLLNKNYSESETYDKTLQTTKHKIKWSSFF